jgi:hypothetical protein
VLCIGETLEEAKENLRQGGARVWANKMETVYRVMDHKWALTGVPNAEQIEDEIVSLSDKLNDKCTSIACGGIVLDTYQEEDLSYVEIEILYSPPIYEDELEEEDEVL